ncbi:signal peptidase. Serine peptidase. MEROPS family S26A [Priestia megaterium]|uniref:signal peptidase I n=1 Tax=Priestia megaterium TaxID=1404 RepID=UPI0008F00027|nr:signal peptidase I [Priestia megaterium]MDM8147895.1 signal peptidase I [Priestia megaterium]SFG53577.1 signal peptidase. Serine peptidase. MEROPS family S26A [Priestia megaterium]
MVNKKLKREILTYISVILGTVLLSVVVQHYWFQPYTVKGDSMKPILHEGNRIIINKHSKLERFDIVVLQAPYSSDFLVKRIVGLPGETVEYKDDVLYINNKVKKEPHLHKYLSKVPAYERFTENFSTYELSQDGTIPDGYVLVLGDNRRISRDGRHFGLTPISSIMGEVNMKYWPLKEMTLMH